MGACGQAATLRNFQRVGRGQNASRFVSARLMRVHTRMRTCMSVCALNFLIFSVFCHGFSAVTSMTEALQVVFVSEKLFITIVWDDVIDVCRTDTSPALCAFLTPRFSQ